MYDFFDLLKKSLYISSLYLCKNFFLNFHFLSKIWPKVHPCFFPSFPPKATFSPFARNRRKLLTCHALFRKWSCFQKVYQWWVRLHSSNTATEQFLQCRVAYIYKLDILRSVASLNMRRRMWIITKVIARIVWINLHVDRKNAVKILARQHLLAFIYAIKIY